MRIALIGWATRTGIGAMNLDLMRSGIVDRWLAPKHPALPYDTLALEHAEPCSVHSGDGAMFRGIDAVLFVEKPFLEPPEWLIRTAREFGVLTCCIPMIEWLPPPWEQAWAREVDCMWATSPWARQRLAAIAQESRTRKHHVRWEQVILGNRWGVDLEQFTFTQRRKAERIVFINGQGGVGARKGADVFARAARLIPQIPLVARTQSMRDFPRMPSNVEVLVGDVENRFELFAAADVVLCPSKWEGLGLQPYEAMACGAIPIVTDADPIRQCGAARKIQTIDQQSINLAGIPTPSHTADAAHLARLIQKIYGQDIAAESLANRRHIEARHDLKAVAAELVQALKGLRTKAAA